MGIIEKGTAPHSYIIKLFGIRIRFRNKFSFKNNKIIIVDKKGKEHKKIPKGLKIKFLGANATVKIFEPCPKFVNTQIFCTDNVNITISASIYKLMP